VEILWQVGLTGRHKASELDENSSMRWRMRCWISRACRINTRGLVDENKHHGALFRFKVFHRDGRPASAAAE
jgi:endonuclease-8